MLSKILLAAGIGLGIEGAWTQDWTATFLAAVLLVLAWVLKE